MSAPAPPRIFSPTRRIARDARHAHAAPDHSAQFLRSDMAEDILERLAFMQVEPARVLLLGDRPNLLRPSLEERGFTVRTAGPDTIDEEQPFAAPAFDILVSMGLLDTVNDLPGALLHVRRALPEGGLFFASFTGAGSLPQLRRILAAADGERTAARLHPQIDTQGASALMQRAGFSRQVVDSRTLTVSYRSFERHVADLRAQGMSGVLADTPPPLTRASLDRAKEAFAAQADDTGRVTETFEILTLTGWT
ncbi:hypothetical protein F7D01_14925 [Erythrobacter sp. 3-20A1M]|uniref:class I SAM-dependent methyltransferase n=1 Tax=Erythrobacter sp. 3-20A1M TaxID=2653850 RepID=UPI001BFC4C5E|nr:class I SAM-dependent methyltransferase [Erythrobacter sp. 3-20A1M]QWC58190.1 hypothetical protein F7D01_14925 [Erythrobacter sp. 3-20A1M]